MRNQGGGVELADYPIEGEPTTFQEIYNRFLGRITDDMYMEWTEEDTKADLYNILMAAIPGFEFPRFPLYDYGENSFNCHLTGEEINILAVLMMIEWVHRQTVSIENTRQKYSGSDFKMTSQANHLDKLMILKQELERQDRHYQRLYKRRKVVDNKGSIKSNWSILRESSALGE